MQTWGARRNFAGCLQANSHERSAQTGISLGSTFVRIGRRLAALRTALLSMAKGPFSPRACWPPENLSEKTWPTWGRRRSGAFREQS